MYINSCEHVLCDYVLVEGYLPVLLISLLCTYCNQLFKVAVLHMFPITSLFFLNKLSSWVQVSGVEAIYLELCIHVFHTGKPQPNFPPQPNCITSILPYLQEIHSRNRYANTETADMWDACMAPMHPLVVFKSIPACVACFYRLL